MRAGCDQRGVTLVELLAVVAVLAVIAGVVIVAVVEVGDRARVSACRTERAEFVGAIEAMRIQNDRGEYPPVAGVDGLDAMRAAGLLDSGRPSDYWRYGPPIAPGSSGPRNLVRRALDVVPAASCS
jgi:general secretion pathway protein G